MIRIDVSFRSEDLIIFVACVAYHYHHTSCVYKYIIRIHNLIAIDCIQWTFYEIQSYRMCSTFSFITLFNRKKSSLQFCLYKFSKVLVFRTQCYLKIPRITTREKHTLLVMRVLCWLRLACIFVLFNFFLCDRSILNVNTTYLFTALHFRTCDR